MVCVNRNMLEQLLLKWVIAPLPTANRQIYATPGEKPQYPLDKEGGGGGLRHQNCDALVKKEIFVTVGNQLLVLRPVACGLECN